MPIRRVLVVDDDPAIRGLVSDLLLLKGHIAVCAPDGERALSLLAQSSPDLMLLDMQMPGLSGPDVADQVRAGGNDIPIVVMSGSPTSEQWARDIGADGYLSKPFNLLDLLNTVESVGRPKSVAAGA